MAVLTDDNFSSGLSEVTLDAMTRGDVFLRIFSVSRLNFLQNTEKLSWMEYWTI